MLLFVACVVFVLIDASRATDVDCSVEYKSRCKQYSFEKRSRSGEVDHFMEWCPNQDAFLTCMWSYEESCSGGENYNSRRDLHERKLSVLTDICDPNSSLHKEMVSNQKCIHRAYKRSANCRKAAQEENPDYEEYSSIIPYGDDFEVDEYAYNDANYVDEHVSKESDDNDDDEYEYESFDSLMEDIIKKLHENDTDYGDDDDDSDEEFDSVLESILSSVIVDNDEEEDNDENDYIADKDENSNAKDDEDDNNENEDNGDDYDDADNDSYESFVNLITKFINIIRMASGKKTHKGDNDKYSMNKDELSCLIEQVASDCGPEISDVLLELQRRLQIKFLPIPKESSEEETGNYYDGDSDDDDSNEFREEIGYSMEDQGSGEDDSFADDILSIYEDLKKKKRT